MTNNEIQEQGQIEDQQPVMDDYNNQGNLLMGIDIFLARFLYKSIMLEKCGRPNINVFHIK